MEAGKLIIFSAPSGSGKSTLINYLCTQVDNLAFSISCTSRLPRGKEEHGREYYFLSADEFRRRIAAGEFLEYEEVYADMFYGTLKSEVERLAAGGKNIIFDVDVKGGINIKRYYGDRALSIFIQPPSIEALRARLKSRATDAAAIIEKRIERAAYELAQAEHFDTVIVNDDLEKARAEVVDKVRAFLNER